MEEMFTPEGPGGPEETLEKQRLMENKAGIFQNLRWWSERLPQVRLRLVQLLISMGLFLLLVTILSQVSRFQQALQSWPGARKKSQSPATQKQIQEELEVINYRLARMNVTLERLCRQCPWDWELFQGSCYWFSRSQSDWMSTDSACQRMNARLVVVNSVSEEKFLQSWEIRHEKRTWIGLSDHHDEASWRWVDGTPLQLSFWKPGEPNNDNNEDCVELYNDGWNDDKCHKEKAWICEKPMVSCTNV